MALEKVGEQLDRSCEKLEFFLGSKPRIRWEDFILRDTLDVLEIRGLGRRTENGVEWRGLLGEARAQKGL